MAQNPLQTLDGVIDQLYDLSENDNVSAEQQQQLSAQADNLRKQLNALVALGLSANDAKYQDLIANLNNVTNRLNQGEQKIQSLINAVAGAADVAAAVDDLIGEVEQLGATAAKLAA